MPNIVPAIGRSAAFGLIIISVMANAAFGHSLTDGNERFIYAATFAFLDAFKAVLPVLAGLAWQSGQMAKTVSTLIIFTILSAVSFTAEIGLYATTKAHVLGDASAARAKYEAAIADRERIEARIAAIGDIRSASEIRADVETARLDKIFARSKECSDVTLDDSRNFCGGLARLNAELQKAIDIAGLRRRLDDTVSKLSEMDISLVMRSADPQAETLARLAGPFISADPGTVRSALAVLIALLIEIGSGLGLWLSTGHRPAQRERLQETIKDSQVADHAGRQPHEAPAAVSEARACHVERWLAECVADRKGGYVTAREMLESFASWCALHSEKNIGQTLLGKRLGELDYAKKKQGGTIRYLDIALRPVRTEVRLAAVNG
jgi:hypothetical protein